jgi:hypothetical protein
MRIHVALTAGFDKSFVEAILSPDFCRELANIFENGLRTEANPENPQFVSAPPKFAWPLKKLCDCQRMRERGHLPWDYRGCSSCVINITDVPVGNLPGHQFERVLSDIKRLFKGTMFERNPVGRLYHLAAVMKLDNHVTIRRWSDKTFRRKILHDWEETIGGCCYCKPAGEAEACGFSLELKIAGPMTRHRQKVVRYTFLAQRQSDRERGYTEVSLAQPGDEINPQGRCFDDWSDQDLRLSPEEQALLDGILRQYGNPARTLLARIFAAGMEIQSTNTRIICSR